MVYLAALILGSWMWAGHMPVWYIIMGILVGLVEYAILSAATSN